MSGSITRVVENRRGVRLHFKPHAFADELTKLMRCHLAFSRARGYAEHVPCPLYFKGVSIERVRGEDAVDIVGADRDVTLEIQTQARIVFGTPATGNVPLNVTAH